MTEVEYIFKIILFILLGGGLSATIIYVVLFPFRLFLTKLYKSLKAYYRIKVEEITEEITRLAAETGTTQTQDIPITSSYIPPGHTYPPPYWNSMAFVKEWTEKNVVPILNKQELEVFLLSFYNNQTQRVGIEIRCSCKYCSSTHDFTYIALFDINYEEEIDHVEEGKLAEIISEITKMRTCCNGVKNTSRVIRARREK